MLLEVASGKEAAKAIAAEKSKRQGALEHFYFEQIASMQEYLQLETTNEELRAQREAEAAGGAAPGAASASGAAADAGAGATVLAGVLAGTGNWATTAPRTRAMCPAAWQS